MFSSQWNQTIVCLYFSLQETYEAKRQEFFEELQRKEEEMRQTFVQRVREKETVLKEAEREVLRPFLSLYPSHWFATPNRNKVC